MNTNPRTIRSITAHPTFRGVALHPRSPVTEESLFSAEKFTRMATGAQEEMGSLLGWKLGCSIAAELADVMAMFNYYSTQRIGQCVGPHHINITSVASGTEVLTVDADIFATGDIVFYSYDETDVSGGNASTKTAYYYKRITSTTGSLHTSSGDATSGAAPVNFTVNGACTGVSLSHEFPLVIHRDTGIKRTYRQALITKLPVLRCAGGRIFVDGTMEWRALPAIGTAPGGDLASDVASFYAETGVAYAAPTWTGGEVLSVAPTAEWLGAPWDDFEGIGGFAVEIVPSLTPLDGSQWREQFMRYGGCEVTIKFTPIGLTVNQYQAVMGQAAGVLRDAVSFVIHCGTFDITIYGALADNAATIYDPSGSFIQEMTVRGRVIEERPFLAPFAIATV